MNEKFALIKTIIDIINEKENISELLDKYNFQKSTSSVSIIISSEVKDGQTNMYAITPKTLIYENVDYAVNLLYDEDKNYIDITFLTNEDNINIIDEICAYFKMEIKIYFFGKGKKGYFLESFEKSNLRNILVLIDNSSEKNIQIQFSQNTDIQKMKFADILRMNGINKPFEYLKTEGIGKIFFLLKLYFALVLNLLYFKIIKIVNIFIKIETKNMIKRNRK